MVRRRGDGVAVDDSERGMIGVDFRTVGTAEQVWRALLRVIGRVRLFRTGLLAASMLFAFVGVETIRLAGALHTVHELELRRDTLAVDVQKMQARVKEVRDRRAALLSILARRRSNAELAARIAATSDVLASSMALIQLRVAPDGFDIEGRGTSLTDIRASLGRLETIFNRPATFELRRDEVVPSAISFHFDIASK